MQTTSISWCDYTWNPQTGCSRIGPICYDSDAGVPKCYAEKFSRRQERTDSKWTPENANENVTMHPERVHEPDDYHFPEGPGRVFVGSMTDMFHSETDPAFVQDVLDVCARHPEHVWIWLTKRPHNAAEWRLDWPENCLLGTSVGSAGHQYPSTLHRIEQLRDIDVGLKWVSFEPLLEPIGEVALDHIDWVVVGGESAPDEHRREMKHEWADAIRRQCRDEGISFYFKQSSAARPERGTALTVFNEEYGVFEQREIEEFPDLPTVTKAARADAEESE
jgi:protein gp37